MEDYVLKSLSKKATKYTFKDGVLKLGEGDNYGIISFDEKTGTVTVTPCVVPEGE